MNKNLFSLALSDLLTPQMLVVTFMPIVILFAIFGLLSGVFGVDLFHYIQTEFLGYFNLTPQDIEEKLNSNFILAFLAKLDFLVWIFKFIFYALLLYIGWNIAIIVGMMITGFFAPYIIKFVNRGYDLELYGHGNILTSLIFSGKVILIFIILFSIGLILFWVPIINIIFFYFAFYYLFHKMLVRDVSSEINTKVEVNEIKKIKANSIRFHSFLLYLINNIPFVGILAQTFSIIYMSHFYLRESQKLRN